MNRFLSCLAFAVLTATTCFAQAPQRERQSWDTQWKFFLGDNPAASASSFNDASWRHLVIPHDWSIEAQTDPNAPSAGGGGFFPTGTGWYRRNFVAPTAWLGKRILLEFEGIAGVAEIFLNGKSLATHPNPFTTFFADLTPQLQFGRDNVLAIRVDNGQQPNTRFYTGSGLYRHVWLNITSPINVAPWGVFACTTDLAADRATIQIQTKVRNTSDAPATVTVQTLLFGPDGNPTQIISDIPPPQTEIIGGGEQFVTYCATIKAPHPWSPESPDLYRAVTRLFSNVRPMDEVSTSFGLRTLKVSASHGFELNGQPIKLNGANIHSDHGPLGAAAFDRAEIRKVEILKAAGYNAVRTAHNPPAPAFLDACDRFGLLVIEEAFDCWEKGKTTHDYAKFFKDWWQRDIDSLVLRDRNHPSIIMWSIGNEVYERGSPNGGTIAFALTKRIRDLDSTRPLTAGLNGMGKSGDWTKTDPVFATLDVAGYNYEIARHTNDHVRLPARVIMATESYQSETFSNWSQIQAQPYLIGDFVWSGIDYLGESGIGRIFSPDQPVIAHWQANFYPSHGATCGDIDLTGWRKSISHYRSIVWDRGEQLYTVVQTPTDDGRPWNLSLWSVAPAMPSWTWPGLEGKPLQIEVYSRYPSVRLYFNDQLIGEKPTTQAQAFKATFTVTYKPGILKTVGIANGREMESSTLETAGKSLRLRLTADRSTLKADQQDLVFINVEATDSDGRVHPFVDQSVRYKITGPATLAAIGSGDLDTTESYHANPRRLHQGRSLVILRSTQDTGEIVLTAEAPGLKPASITIKSTLNP